VTETIRPAEPVEPAWLARVALFITGQTLSLFGSAVVMYAVIWHVTIKTGSGWQYAVLFIGSNLAAALVTLPGGVWADRYWRKALIIGADLFVAVFTVGLALVLLAGHEDLWLIVAVLCLRGLAGGVQAPAVNASIPQLVPPRALLRVNSVNASLQSLTSLGAPPLAAVLLVYVPLGGILLVDVVTALIGVACVLGVAIPRPGPASHPPGVRSYVTQTTEAARYAWGVPQLRRVAWLTIVTMVIISPPAMMTPVLVVRLFGPEEWKLAVVETLWSAGMVIGGVVLAVWGGLRNRMTLLLITAAAWGIWTIGMGAAPNIWVFCALMVVYGLSLPSFITPAMTSVQQLVPPSMLGRAMGFAQLFPTLATPLGLAVAGPLADLMDIRVLTIACGVLGLLLVLGLALDRGPASRLYAPEPTLPPEQR
jgi:DHA3 family macrolide efflux protein-like MFS transporter